MKEAGQAPAPPGNAFPDRGGIGTQRQYTAVPKTGGGGGGNTTTRNNSWVRWGWRGLSAHVYEHCVVIWSLLPSPGQLSQRAPGRCKQCLRGFRLRGGEASWEANRSPACGGVMSILG
eukprot:8892431-Pyramimonas_sp.AAC.1